MLILVSEIDLMFLIRCALFRDCWLDEGISQFIMDQLSPENRKLILGWEEVHP